MNAEAVIEQLDKLPAEEKQKVRDYLDNQVIGDETYETDVKPLSKRKAGLHPGAMEMAPDFDEPLSDDFWLGKE